MTPIEILPARAGSITVAGGTSTDGAAMVCDSHSLAGSVTQRACVFCGSRVVLYPIADALHVVHGPMGIGRRRLCFATVERMPSC